MQIIPPNIGAEIALLRASAAGVRDKALLRAMLKCGLIARDEARRNAPISPTQSLINNTRKTSKRSKTQDRSTGRAKPGGLERSIKWRAEPDNAVVFVASNSEAGKYALKIHDEKGISWFKLGPGSVAKKGGRVDDKFIERAINDNQDEFARIIKTEIGKAMP
jgi:hypothetical protein